MTSKFLTIFLAIAFIGFGSAAKAQSQDANGKSVYPVAGVPGTFANVVLAAIKQGALDMSSDGAIDDFAKVEYCDIYKKYRDNEFDWRRVRVAMRKKIDLDKPNYPDTLYLERSEKIANYDFTAGMLLLAQDSILHTRALQLAMNQNELYCNAWLTTFPEQFLALLDKALVLDGIDLTEEEARAVTDGLEKDPNSSGHLAYGRYTITLTGSEPARSTTGPIMLDAKLDNVTLYQDGAYTRPFWSGQSSMKSYKQRENAGALDVIPFKGIDPAEQAKIDAAKPVPDVTPPVAPPPASK